MRKSLAYETLAEDATLSLTADQQKEIKGGLKEARGDLAEAIRRTYRQLFIPARSASSGQARDGLKELDLGIPTYGEDKPLDEEVYEKLQLDGEILEKIAPLVIRERYLWEQEYVLTEQLAQAGLRTPGETRVVSREAWEQGIAEGVRQGLFGLGTLEEGRPVCRYFGKKEEPFVGLAGSEVIILAEVCQAQRAAEAGRTTYGPPAVADIAAQEGSLTGVGGAPEGAGAGGRRRVPALPRRRLRLQFTVPKGKVSGLMGVMNLLQHKFDRLDIVLSAEHGEISEQEYEDKIQEAFRQLGIEVMEE